VGCQIGTYNAMRVDWAKSALDHTSHANGLHSKCELEAKPAPKEFKFTALALYNLRSNIVHTLDFWLSDSPECMIPANLTGPSVLADAAERARYSTRRSLLRRARGLTGKPRELVSELSKIVSSGSSKTVELDPISIHILPVNASEPVGEWMALAVPHTWELRGTKTYLCHGAAASGHRLIGSKRTYPCLAELSFKPLVPQLHHPFIGPNEYLDNSHRTSPWFVMLVESCMAVAIIVVTTMLLLLCTSAVLHLCRKEKQKRHKKRWFQGQATTSVGGYLKSQVLLVGFYIAAQISVDDILDMFPQIADGDILAYVLIGSPSLIFGLAVHGTFRTYKLGLAHEECLDTDFRLLELPCRSLHKSVAGRLCLALVLCACIAFFAATLRTLPTCRAEWAGLVKVAVIYLGLLLWCLWQLVKNRETRTRWNRLTIASTSIEDEPSIGRRRTDHTVAGHQHEMPRMTVFRPQRLLGGRALKELAARTIALGMFSIGMFVCCTGSLDRLQKSASLHDCQASTGSTTHDMTMPFLHDAHVRTIYVDWSVKRLRIQCLPDALTKGVRLGLLEYLLQQPINLKRRCSSSAGENSPVVFEVPLSSGPWPARLDLQTDGYNPQHYILYVIRVDTAVQLELRASFNGGRGNETFREARRLDYQRSHSMWYLPKLSGEPQLHMKAIAVVLAPLYSSDARKLATGNVILGKNCSYCTADVPGFGSKCGLVRNNVSGAQGDSSCLFVREPVEMLQSIPTQRLPSRKSLAKLLQRSAGHGASLCMNTWNGRCTQLERANQTSTSQHLLSQYFKSQLTMDEWNTHPGLLLLGGEHDFSEDQLQHSVHVQLVPHAPPARFLARLSTDVGRDSLLEGGQFMARRFRETELSYTVCYPEGTSFHSMPQFDANADDERFVASWFNTKGQAVTSDVCRTPGTHLTPVKVQYITMQRKLPCKKTWCNSYQQRSSEFLADYRLVHELAPTAKCAVAAVKYKDPAVSLWFKSCANTTSKGLTPLMVASARGSIIAVELQLTNANADPNIRSVNWEETALHFAAKNGHAEVVQILVQHRAELESANRFGMRPLHTAIRLDSSKGVASLLGARAEVESAIKVPDTLKSWEIPSLLYAVYEGHLSVVKLLLDFRADVNKVGGKDQVPPLMVPVLARSQRGYGSWRLWPLNKPKSSATRNIKQMLELLLNYRADIRYQIPRQGDTVLHKACRRCLRDDVLQVLVNHSSDLLARNDLHLTPMQTFSKYCDKKRLILVQPMLWPADNRQVLPAKNASRKQAQVFDAMKHLPFAVATEALPSM